MQNKNEPDKSLSCSKKRLVGRAVGSKTKTIGISRAYEECEGTLTKSLKRNNGERTGILIAPSSSLVFLDFAKFLRSVFSAHCLGGKVGFGVPILAARMASRCFIYIHALCNLAMGGSAPALGARYFILRILSSALVSIVYNNLGNLLLVQS
jgi:hypothetical protein